MCRLLSIAIKDIFRKRFKTVIFTLIISTCISALILSYSMNTAMNNAIDTNMVNSLASREIFVAVNNSEGKSYDDYLQYIRTLPHIEDVYKYIPEINAEVHNEELLLQGEYSINSGPEKYFPRSVAGRNFSEEEKNVSIIPEKLYINNGSSMGMKIIQGKSLIGKTIEFSYKNETDSSKYIYTCKVVGIYRNQLGDSVNKIYIPLNDMYKICTDSGKYKSSSNLLLTAIVDKQQSVETAINEISSTNNISAKLSHPQNKNELGVYEKVSKVSKYMVYSILIFLLLMLYICVTNMAVDNNKQVALYKALGYNNKHIFHIAFSESLIISIMGYIVGIVIAALADSLIINPFIYSRSNLVLSVSIPLISCIIPLIAILVISFIVSLFIYIKVKSIYPAILLKQD